MSLSKPNQNISGGIYKIEYTLMSDLATFRINPSNNTISYDFITGRSFSIAYFTKGSVIFKPEHKITVNGHIYNYTLDFDIPGIDATRSLFLTLFEAGPFLVRITENNGSRLLIPYAKLVSPESMGKVLPEFTGNTISFSSSLPFRAPVDQSFYVANTPVEGDSEL
ncbi:MAG: hypothetical protein V1775_00255 [Bacteroidota bacterium]